MNQVARPTPSDLCPGEPMAEGAVRIRSSAEEHSGQLSEKKSVVIGSHTGSGKCPKACRSQGEAIVITGPAGSGECQHSQLNLSVDAIVIAGPTGSGKSSHALALASRIPGSYVVNCDSRQVYRGLKTLTAQPEESTVPHYLYGYCEASKTNTMSQWYEDISNLIKSKPAGIPIIVGGTGLYVQCLLEGTHQIPPRNPNSRYNALSKEECFAKLTQIDPKYAAIIKDHRRAIRALEIWEESGVTMSQLHSTPKQKLIDLNFQLIYMDSPNLRQRLTDRLQRDINLMIEEVRNEYRHIQGTQLENSIGVKEIKAYLEGQNTLEATVAAIINKTWQYARRQRVWFKKFYKADAFCQPE